jgi:hypothetical protein
VKARDIAHSAEMKAIVFAIQTALGVKRDRQDGSSDA